MCRQVTGRYEEDFRGFEAAIRYGLRGEKIVYGAVADACAMQASGDAAFVVAGQLAGLATERQGDLAITYAGMAERAAKRAYATGNKLPAQVAYLAAQRVRRMLREIEG
jgi:hypothetical protein